MLYANNPTGRAWPDGRKIPIGVVRSNLESDEGRRRRYLHRLFDGTYRRNIVQRYDIRRTAEMDALARFLASNIGSLTSVQNVVYNELTLRGYEVGVGRVTARESVGGDGSG